MDYEGQRLAELLFYWIILSFGAVGWVIGYFQQDFMIVFQFWLVGVAISVVVSNERFWLGFSGESVENFNYFTFAITWLNGCLTESCFASWFFVYIFSIP